MPVLQFASIGTFSQMNKAIPLLLEMRNDIKEVRRNTDTTPQVFEEVRGIREDIPPGYANNFRQMQTDIRAIKERRGMLGTLFHRRVLYLAMMQAVTRAKRRNMDQSEADYVDSQYDYLQKHKSEGITLEELKRRRAGQS